jgi:hypothetical protein
MKTLTILFSIAAILAVAAYWFAPAHVILRMRIAAKTFLSAPPIILANAEEQRTPLANVTSVSAFEDFERLPNDDFNPAPRQMVLANEGRFESTYFSEPLTNYATGWLEQYDIKQTLDRIAPEVPVGRRFEYKKGANAEFLLSETDDVRAIGGDFKRVEFTGTSANDKTLNKGLTIRVDDDEQKFADWQERYTRMLMQRLFRNELRRAIAALSAAATNTAKTWDTSAGKDPDFDVLAEIEATGDARGMDSNVVLFGSTSWRRRALAHRAQNTAGGFASASMTPDELAQLYGVDRVVVSKERYQSTATAKAQVVANKVLIYMAPDMITKDDPSNIKRFVSAVDGGGFVRVFAQRMGAKFSDITVEHYSNIILPDTTGISQFTVS